MLEKIGLPEKPSLKGNAWVVDASHCQTCSSQFTFINRKHHCRRCGGIFCGKCTQQRMVLRGQGDSPVRICDPCKKLEEAAKFERYGNKTRAAKGGSKYGSSRGDELLNQILGNDGKNNITQNNSASSSNILEVLEGGYIDRNLSLDQNTDVLTDVGSATPEDLRQQSIAEKARHRTLKAEGKPEEALKAFKRGKELERQAAALEISLRKNRKKALSFADNTEDILQQIKDDSKPSPDNKNKLPKKKIKETNDLSSDLKELGWSDLDIRAAEKKPAASVEGELSSLLREVSQKPNKEKRIGSSEKSSQVIVHKKKALELKRAGNLLEAKEELKRAKILEKKIEEEELLGESDESDDELSSLIRDMDGDDKEGDLLARYDKQNLDIDFSQFGGIADNIPVDGNFEVTDDDMNDPEIASALQSFGWDEDTPDPEIASSDKESTVTEIRSLKIEALNQKRAGNTVEAMSLLRKAKLLEKELENSDSMNTGPDIIVKEVASPGPKLAPKSKLVIQRELIALKKKALTLRREGKVDESDEELKKAKALEEQLEDMNKAAAPVIQPSVDVNAALGNVNEEDEEVTDQDLGDPAYASLLKNLGWDEEESVTTSKENNGPPKYTKDSPITQSVGNVEEPVKSRKSKSEIQRELLQLKRKALTLRRQGEGDEADEVLNMAKLLEAQLEEFEKPSQTEYSLENNEKNSPIDAIQNTESSFLEVNPQVKDSVTLEKPITLEKPEEKPYIQELHSSPENSISLQKEIMAHKRKALAFKREGKLAEAKEELRQAKLLEKSVENSNAVPQSDDIIAPVINKDAPAIDKDGSPSAAPPKQLSGRDRFKIQQESLAHKRKSLKLRREGKTAEADAEYELAKALELQLQDLDAPDSGEPAGDVSVEDFLDPQLLFALRSVGLEDDRTNKSSQLVVEKPELTKVNADPDLEREQLVEQIRAEKVKALSLKRSGKPAEALDALKRAKLFEKKLQTLTSI
ncbi:PREDICTED: uncharacterized protein LOC105963114 isoform X2 [Erythranthe guttata]|uniref:uncharacterized protein LOC105963114 isoform X2 n=1 Tax=Erythranthe guttata TaxID=4155 RepID=UPI00064D8D86|nr:PREDICTED: uncharacterized protein LOC105963114 isoform X2 [Erythranthe guttata]|eukprot:XP_012842937.1 PREDICTED: uncharacterized protein LOC105963114 isoform X2 [Erythranthe guttata]